MTSTRSFAVVTDSTSDLPEDLLAENSIEMVPLSVIIGGETFQDRQLTQAQFFERMNAAAELPTTSQPPVGLFAETYERALSAFDAVLSIHISEKLSGTIDSARRAADQFAGKVHVVDSRNLSLGLGFQVLEAARCAAEGMPAEEAIGRVAQVRDRVKMIVGLDSLKNLAKGGRIGRVSAFLGGVLDVKVTLTVSPDGSFEPVKRSRGEHAALDHTLAWIGEKMGQAPSGSFAVGHAMEPDRAQWLREQLERRFDVTRMVMYETGSVIATHTGTGWGVTVLPD